MRRCLEVAVSALVVLTVFAAVRLANAGPKAPKIENLRLPLEFYEDGTIRRQLKAGIAEVPAKGPIEGKKVRLECFDPAGELELLVISDKCVYDRDSGTATSSDSVRVAARGILISGKGFEWQTDKQTVDLHENCRVVFNRKIKELGRRNAGKK